MTVKELNRNQLDELKWQVYCDPEQYGEFEYFHNITDDHIYKFFDGIDFVNDDFSCSMNCDIGNYTPFTDDPEKIHDLLLLSQNDFLKSYSYLTPDEYKLTVIDIINKLFPKTQPQKTKTALKMQDVFNLKRGDTVYIKCGSKYIKSVVIRPPFYNCDADEKGLEIETNNGFSDLYSIYQ